MAENKRKNLPQFDSIEDLVDFFDENDLGEYENDLPEVSFDVALKKRKYLVGIDEQINKDLTEIALQENVSTESLVNSWLKEKISNYSEIK